MSSPFLLPLNLRHAGAAPSGDLYARVAPSEPIPCSEWPARAAFAEALLCGTQCSYCDTEHSPTPDGCLAYGVPGSGQEGRATWQAEQDFPMCPDSDDPDSCNVYRELRLLDQIHGNIGNFWEGTAEAQEQNLCRGVRVPTSWFDPGALLSPGLTGASETPIMKHNGRSRLGFAHLAWLYQK